ncbi:CsgG/HfaB family protein, partial [uncultured Fretibacterium sp.]|uniref:CsgG/HfaB family protein n=1 Tax=uncultured Fretibacterium sp. TaxID=1678694 RepID=UPI00262EC526
GAGGASNTAYVTLDIRLIDNQTSEVVYAAAAQGASNQTLGGLITKYGGFGAGKVNGILAAATRKAVMKHVEAMRDLKLE